MGIRMGGPVDRKYRVIVNEEEAYSIWLDDRATPHGWKDAGYEGSKWDCLHYIEEVWTDMRPLSLRRMMEREPDRGR